MCLIKTDASGHINMVSFTLIIASDDDVNNYIKYKHRLSGLRITRAGSSKAKNE